MSTTPPTSRIVIAGGSGFLGSNLVRHLSALGYQVLILSRSPKTTPNRTSEKWDARTLGPWAKHLDGASALINFAGRSVDCFKTPEHKDEILRSRVEATLALGRACREIDNPPPVWVQMSTAHIYGDPPEIICDESSPFGVGLAPTVGHTWEQAFNDSAPSACRKVIFRTSFVLGRSGGALPRLAFLARIGLGGTVASGKQGMSWIHQHDMNRLFHRAIEDESMQGAYIATAPNPVSNKFFMRELRRAMHIPIGLPAPTSLVRIGAPLVMRTDPELAIYGRYCVSKRLAESGFTFSFPDLPAALTDLFCR